MGWLIAAGILILLGVLPLGVSARYNADGVRVRVIAGPVRVTVFPMSRKRKKQKREKKPLPPRQEKKEESGQSVPQETGGSLKDFFPLVRLGLDFLGDFRRKLRVNVLEVKLILAGGDPADLAINYGRIWASAANLDPLLQRVFIIKKKKIDIGCDFTAQSSTVIARLDLTITLGRLLGLGVRYGLRGVREFMKIKSKRKGGAENESKSS